MCKFLYECNIQYKLYKDNDLAKTKRLHILQGAGQIIRIEGNRIPRKVLFSQIKDKLSLIHI